MKKELKKKKNNKIIKIAVIALSTILLGISYSALPRFPKYNESCDNVRLTNELVNVNDYQLTYDMSAGEGIVYYESTQDCKYNLTRIINDGAKGNYNVERYLNNNNFFISTNEEKYYIYNLIERKLIKVVELPNTKSPYYFVLTDKNVINYKNNSFLIYSIDIKLADPGKSTVSNSKFYLDIINKYKLDGLWKYDLSTGENTKID